MNAVEQGKHNGGKLVSVIVPAYNVAGYIAETLDSVFAQTFQNFELILVNDGSPDSAELERVLAPYRDRLVYIVQQNKGISGARNAGIAAATGEFIAFLDGDDAWMPRYLEVQLAFLDAHPEYDLVYCNAVFFGNSPEAGTLFMNLCPSRGEADFDALVRRDCHVFTSVLARRRMVQSVGGFDESLGFCEDFDLWLRFAAAGHRIGYHREILVRYRKHGTSLSANRIRMTEFGVKVLSKHLAVCPPGSARLSLVQQALASKHAELDLRRGKQALAQGDTASALHQIGSANRFYRSTKLTLTLLLLRWAPRLLRSLYLRHDSSVQPASKAAS